MKESLISFETAKLAKEKGFDAPVKSYWIDNLHSHTVCDKVDFNSLKLNDKISKPTQSLLQKWLREVHNIHIRVEGNVSGDLYYKSSVKSKGHWNNRWNNASKFAKTYEEALEKALVKSLKLI